MSEVVKQRVYYRKDMAKILGISRGNLSVLLHRKSWDTLPPPSFKLGKKNAWLVEDVESFFDKKRKDAVGSQ